MTKMKGRNEKQKVTLCYSKYLGIVHEISSGNFYCKMPICLLKNKGIKCIFGMLVKSCRMEGKRILENKVHVFVVFSLLFQRDYHYFIFVILCVLFIDKMFFLLQ